MSEKQSRAHVDRFNAAVTGGDWPAFVAGFAPDAVMTFVGPPVGPYVGIEAIAEGYATHPPTDTIAVRSVTESADGGDLVRFRWSSGDTGTMTIHRRTDGLITSLAIVFD